MPPPTNTALPSSRPLTLIVATTPVRLASPSSTRTENQSPTTRLGIGLGGTLPWPRIKADMNFFARITSRPPVPGTTNAIIMGRKTYDSVPAHLRPLAKRVNVVITRDRSGMVQEGIMKELQIRRARMSASKPAGGSGSGSGSTRIGSDTPAEKSTDAPPVTSAAATEQITDALVAPSLDAALHELDTVYGERGQLGKIYVIGGAEIYAAALRIPNRSSQLQRRPVRIVMTNVVRTKPAAVSEGMPDGEASFECDTFFPLDGLTPQNGWRSVSAAEVSEWVGEEVSGEWRREGDVEIQMVGFERV